MPKKKLVMDAAWTFLHGQRTQPGMTPEKVYEQHFAPDVNSPYAGTLTLEQIREFFARYRKT